MSLNSGKAVNQVFENYQKARVSFVQNVAELAQNPKNIDALQSAGIMALLRPLLLDTVPSIQHNAAQALGRLANYNAELASAVVNGDILPQLVYSLAEQDKFYKKAAAYVLRSVAKHSGALAQGVVDAGAVDALVSCLEEFDPQVKEAAAWALGSVCRHSGELAQAVVDAGAVGLLVLCVQEPEFAVKRIAASSLSDIAKHSPELAQAVVEKGAIEILAPLLSSKDAKLKRQVCAALGQVAKHSYPLAQAVVQGGLFPALLDRLKDSDAWVRKNAASLLRELAKHPEYAAMIVTQGGAAAVVDYVGEALSQPSHGNGSNSPSSQALPGVVTLGYLGGQAEALARIVQEAGGIPPLLQALQPVHDEVLRKCSAAWALGHLGRHSPPHAQAIAEVAGLTQLLEAYSAADSSDELKKKSFGALKGIVEKCALLPALEPLLLSAPPEVMEVVLAQVAKLLPLDPVARKAFVTSGSLQRLQLIQCEPGSKLKECILQINSAYPEELVLYYSPGYSSALLSKLDDLSIKS